MELPKCPRCKPQGSVMLPLSDFGDGAAVIIKAWICVNPNCGFSVRIDKGVISYHIVSGLTHK